MKHESGIDHLFREGIGQPDFPGKDAAWAKMEEVLEADKRRRRPFAWMLVLALLTGTAGWWLWNPAISDREVVAQNRISDESRQSSVKPTGTQPTAQHVPDRVKPAKATIAIPDGADQPAGIAAAKQQSKPFPRSGSVRMHSATAIEEAAAPLLTATDAHLLQSVNELTQLSRIDMHARPVHQMAVQAYRISRPELTGARKKEHTVASHRKWSVEIVAGSDIFRLNKQLGYYGGLRFNRHLDAGTLISAGLNYSANTVNEQYRLSNKPAQQTEADARLNHITMIRVPLFFQRQLPRSKWALMAGLVPSYIIDASVYNVPGSFTGDPTQYRRFTINDINRFNILFGAGVKYSPFKRISFELSGSYGFTGLVKDSYINQARVNDNFRNIQAGLVYRIR